MPVTHLPAAAGEHWDLKSKLPDAAAHAIYRGVVLSGVAGVEDQAVDWPNLDFRCRGRCVHMGTFAIRFAAFA
jgi:hypothetical protein